MSRSGYSEDYDDDLQLGRWRGIIASATRGKRGQKFFRDLVAALDEMPEKRLIKGALEQQGEVCALGALGKRRGGIDVAGLDRACEDEEWGRLGAVFNVAEQLTQEVMFENDEHNRGFTPEQRWQHVRDWASKQIIPTEDELAAAQKPNDGGRDG